jgi:hypothetical protein
MTQILTIHPYLPSEIGTFSDVHGDIDTLITTLRDVLGVIRKKSGYDFGGKKQRDPELDIFLNLDLNEPSNQILYLRTLNYEWVGSDKVVVIVGDILDATRLDKSLIPDVIILDDVPYSYTSDKIFPHYYPQIEYKILLFINAINADAASLELRTGIKQGKIIKVAGNHEFLNIFSEEPISSTMIPIKRSASYMFPIDLENSINRIKKLPSKPYMTVKGVEYTRFNFFEIGNPGYDAIKTDFKLSYKIGNYIFVHGQLTSNLGWEDHNNITESLSIIPNYNDPDLNEFLILNHGTLRDIKLHLNTGSGPLWGRDWGSPIGEGAKGPNNRIGQRIGIHRANSSSIDDDFCDDVSKVINKFCLTLPESDPNYTGVNLENSKGVNVVLGHCIQSESTIKNQPSMTFIDTSDTEYINEEKTQTILGDNIYYGPAQKVHHRYGTHYNPTIYGISTDCIGTNQNRIYRVDVGASRGFDNQANVDYLNSVEAKDKVNVLNSLYFSRTPQALRIDLVNNKQKITRSKLVNTLYNVPRPDLQTVVSTLNTQGPQGIVNILDTYDKKYRKYKSKYLKKDI